MLYVGLFIILVIITILLLNLRIRFTWSEDRRWLFAGLGRSGIAIDLKSDTKELRLAGLRVKRLKPKEEEEKPEPPKPRKVREKEKREEKKAERKRPWDLLKEIIPATAAAFRHFLLKLLKAIVVEELQAEIRAGFDTPDKTGMAYGYYQAVLGIFPSVVGRVTFWPDWTGLSFSGSARVSVALPLYKFVWRTMVLVWQLPLKSIYRFAIGTKKGEQDVK